MGGTDKGFPTGVEKENIYSVLVKKSSFPLYLCSESLCTQGHWSEKRARCELRAEHAPKRSAGLGVGYLIHFPVGHLSIPRDGLGVVELICTFTPAAPLPCKVH